MSFGRFRYFSFLDVIGMARTKNTVSREETGAEQLKGVRGGRRAQTTSNGKSNELGRGKRANEVGDLPNEASASPASEPGWQRVVEKKAKKKAVKIKGKMGKKIEEKVIVARNVIVVKNQRKRVETKEKAIQDQVVMMRKVETNEKKRQEEEEEVVVVGKRAVAKGGSKAKPGTPKGKKPTDDTSTPFPRRPKNQTLLKIFNNHVAVAIWNGERVRQAMEVVTAWKALPPEVGDRAFALKMANEVLKHLIVVGSSVTSGSTTSAAPLPNLQRLSGRQPRQKRE
ncbi:hypothetical protein Scep_016367 [Stephania cephalantha]|uniref:Uncharacterized protein n=1 Tax=Stephania cephalantha TaxID=152367 RepID=A0AAP0IMH4_9MAGN